MMEVLCAALLFLSDGQCSGGVCSAPPRRTVAVAVAAPVVRAPARAIRAVSVQRWTPRGVFFRFRLR